LDSDRSDTAIGDLQLVGVATGADFLLGVNLTGDFAGEEEDEEDELDLDLVFPSFFTLTLESGHHSSSSSSISPASGSESSSSSSSHSPPDISPISSSPSFEPDNDMTIKNIQILDREFIFTKCYYFPRDFYSFGSRK
jgi:hypothetical protein